MLPVAHLSPRYNIIYSDVPSTEAVAHAGNEFPWVAAYDEGRSFQELETTHVFPEMQVQKDATLAERKQAVPLFFLHPHSLFSVKMGGLCKCTQCSISVVRKGGCVSSECLTGLSVGSGRKKEPDWKPW
jgi:hypothetical protein